MADASGNPLYRNRNTESASDKAKRKANREIKEMAERLSADQSIIVSNFLLISIFCLKFKQIHYLEFSVSYISYGSKK
jgi:hypothetical protein